MVTDTPVFSRALIEEGGAANQEIVEEIKKLTVAEKMKLALLGNLNVRSQLIKDNNKTVALSVMDNPRLTEGEVVDFAKNTNLDHAVLRRISSDKNWMKSYAVKLSLVGNPKTPIDISLKWVKFLKDKDLRLLARSKNIPSGLSVQCRKLLEARK